MERCSSLRQSISPALFLSFTNHIYLQKSPGEWGVRCLKARRLRLNWICGLMLPVFLIVGYRGKTPKYLVLWLRDKHEVWKVGKEALLSRNNPLKFRVLRISVVAILGLWETEKQTTYLTEGSSRGHRQGPALKGGGGGGKWVDREEKNIYINCVQLNL